MSRSLFKTGLVICLAGTLAACGDSGSGGGGSPTKSPLQVDPGSYETTPVAIRRLSDLDTASAAFSDALSIQDWVAHIGDLIDEYGSSYNYTEVSPEYCLEENGNLYVDSYFSPTFEYYEYRLEDCLVPGYGEPLRLNGRYSYDVTSSSDGSRIESEETFDLRGTLGVKRQPVALVGALRSKATFMSNGDSSVVVSVPAMEYLVGNKYLALQGTKIEMDDQPGRFTLNLQSTLISSAMNGYVTISTPTPIVEREYEYCPADGHVVVASDGKIEARYGESTDNGYVMEVLLNGSRVEYSDTCYGGFTSGYSSTPITSSPGLNNTDW